MPYRSVARVVLCAMQRVGACCAVPPCIVWARAVRHTESV